MGYDLELIRKNNWASSCILNGKTEEFTCEDGFRNSDFEKKYQGV